MYLSFKQQELYCYISTKADYDPAKTIYVCAPSDVAVTYESAKLFAKISGWRDVAEADGAVLVLPIVPHGWKSQRAELLMEIFLETKSSFPTQNGRGLRGRNGYLWCWETMIYVVGYEDGATFAGNAVVACPNQFAAAALVNGVPDDYAPAGQKSSHWLVNKVSEEYSVVNRDIPVSIWIMTCDEGSTQEATKYFNKGNSASQRGEPIVISTMPAVSYRNIENKAQQVCIFTGTFRYELSLAQTILGQLFERVIRWKSGPDGNLAPLVSRYDFYKSTSFVRESVSWNGAQYDYFIHIPATLTMQKVKGLPLVFSVHGRGEPAWLFAQKNGWDKLADETGEFILAVPDSPENIWLLERDEGVFECMINQLFEKYCIDKTRVYLTGFSNGGMITREVGTKHPQLFAAISPWNAPLAETYQDFLESGYEQPCFICIGDSDPVTQGNNDTLLEEMLIANHCTITRTATQSSSFVPDKVHHGKNYYTLERGYQEGDRLHTLVFQDEQGHHRVSITNLKNMPHGAIHDESRAAWEFLRQYRRFENSKAVAFVASEE